MSSEMRELVIRALQSAYAHGEKHAPFALHDCARQIVDAALLARTEAGADGADMIQWRYTNAETGEVLTPWTECDAAFREKRKDAPGYQFRELFAHPQDASGDAERFAAVMNCQWLRSSKYGDQVFGWREEFLSRVNAEVAAMQAKEAT